jgi:hypothetical protein
MEYWFAEANQSFSALFLRVAWSPQDEHLFGEPQE